MRVAIAHDYLTQRGGAERVVLALHEAFPEAPIHTTLFQPDGTYPEFSSLDVRPSRLNKVDRLRENHRLALPILASAISAEPVIDADVLICSSSGWAHGYRARGRKLVYCYAPPRWLYQADSYLGVDSRRWTRAALKALSPSLRRWDQRMARSADQYLAISTKTQASILSRYGLTASILPAPHGMDVNLHDEPLAGEQLEPGYFLCVSRLLPYKNVGLVIEAFRGRPDRLVVLGRGPEGLRLKKSAPPNVVFLEGLTDGQVRRLYRDASAVVAASIEDFGLSPLEGAAFGKPSIVLRAGGFLDTVVDGRTGLFFGAAHPADIAAALDRFGYTAWDDEAIRAHAQAFSRSEFVRRIRSTVLELGQS